MFNIEKSINYAFKKAALKGKKVNQDILAAEAGISKQTLYNIFSRDDAKLSQLYSFAKTLDISVYETFEVPGEEKPEISEEEEEPGTAKDLDEAEKWKDKYLDVLEKYNQLLERMSQDQSRQTG